MSDLPDGWERARLADVAEVRLGRQRSPKRATGDRMRPYLRAANVTWSGLDLGDVNEMDFTAAESETYELRPGDLLLSEASGSPKEVGKPAQYAGQIEGCCFQNTLLRVRLPNGLLPDFYEHFFREQALNGRFAAGSRGVGIHHLGATALSDWDVPVSPTAEQARIVVAVEEAFSKLDAGEAGLRSVRKLLRRMRDAILTAAVTGRLVRQDPADTPAEKVLANLGVELLAQDDLPGIPVGWAWASIEAVAASVPNALAIGPFGSNLKVADYSDDGVPLVFVRNIRRRDFRTDLKFVTHQKANDLSSHSVRRGDVLVTKMGDPPGDAAVYTERRTAIITADCIKVTCGPSISPDYLSLAVARGHTKQLLLEVTRGVAQKKVSLGRFRVLPVPVPPIEEQQRIVSEVEREMSFVEACERAIDAGLARSAALRRSVLKAAFEGRLVPQDPTDESAAMLLARIRSERAAATKMKNRKAKTRGGA